MNIRWYCRYKLSYRDIEELMAERAVEVVVAAARTPWKPSDARTFCFTKR